MAASSSSWQQNVKTSGLPGIEQEGERRQASESSQLYDVFINHRGPDVKTTFALQLYEALQAEGLRVFHDSKEKQLGKSFPSTIEMAIRSSAVQIAIFSKGYAESPWCLAELVLMLESEAKIIPVFYDVKPSDLRHLEKGQYAHAFSDYQKKERYLELLDSWKQALHSVSFIAGYEVNNPDVNNSEKQVFDLHKLFLNDSDVNNRDVNNSEKQVFDLPKLFLNNSDVNNPDVNNSEKQVFDLPKLFLNNSDVNNSDVNNSEKHVFDLLKLFQGIVSEVKIVVQRTNPLHVADYPVGLGQIVKDFETRYGLGAKEKEKAMVIGIYGMGGLGKTTLSKELFNHWRSEYTRACCLFDVREACTKGNLPSLQTTLLKELFGAVHPGLHSVEQGTSDLWNCLERSSNLNFLIVLDDIDDVEQLNKLVVMRMVEKARKCLLIVTTRYKSVLVNAGIVLHYKLPEIAESGGRELFCWYAFRQSHPDDGYEELVNGFVEVCRGVPLALRVLGAHVHGKPKITFWRSALNKARKTMPQGILRTLQISFDSLEDNEQDIFMDIACFFIQKPRSIGIRVWDGSGWDAEHALEILEGKCLIEEIKSSSGLCQEDRVTFGMHDHLRDLGREMAKQRFPRRLWLPQDLKPLELKGFQNILKEANGRCFHSFFDSLLDSQITFFSEKWDGSAATSASLLWLQLEGEFRGDSSFPSWVPLQKLECLRISNPHLKRLWQSDVQVPYQLKELHIYDNSLEEFSELLEISSGLENVLLDAEKMPIKGWSLLVFLRIIPMTLSLKSSTISGKIAFNDEGESSLVIWNFKVSGQVAFTNGRESSSIMYRLKELEIDNDREVTKILIDGNHCSSLEDLRLHQMRNLTKVNLKRVQTLSCLKVDNCTRLKSLSGISDITKLADLEISECPMLELELCLAGLNCLERIKLDNSINLKCFVLNSCKNLKVISGFFNSRVLAKLSIHDCPELDLEELLVQGPNNIKSIAIHGCRKLSNLKLYDCQHLKAVSGNFDLAGLWIRDCPELEKLPACFARLTSLEVISIIRCRKLQSLSLPRALSLLQLEFCGELTRVTATSHLTKLVRLTICDCRKLEELPACFARLTSLEEISIIRCGNLQSLSLPTALRLLELKFCGELTSVTATSHLTKLVRLTIFYCRKLEELPACFARLTSLEEISIISCGKLQSISLPTSCSLLKLEYCEELRRVTATSNLRKLVSMKICECPELNELPSIGPLRRVQSIIIECCEKLQDIAAIEELNPRRIMRLSNCGNAAVRNIIKKLKSFPSDFGAGIGRAVHGAESILNPHLFFEMIGTDAVTEIDCEISIPCYLMASQASIAIKQPRDSLSAIIVCAVVDVDSSVSRRDIYTGYSSEALYALSEGTWIVTLIKSWKEEFQSTYNWRENYGMMKKACVVSVKEGEEGKALLVLQRIIHKLYDK